MSGPFSVGTMGDGTVEETPLAHACARGFLKIVELLIQKGADMNYLCSVRSHSIHIDYLLGNTMFTVRLYVAVIR